MEKFALFAFIGVLLFALVMTVVELVKQNRRGNA